MHTYLKALLSFTLVSQLHLANAHDFWLSPTTFHAKDAPANIPVKFLVGHQDDVSPWALSWERIVALRSYSQHAYQDQVPNVMVNNGLISGLADVNLRENGTHILGFESYHSFSSLDAEKFNTYAEKEGLTLVIEEREKTKETNSPGREIYSRKAKTLLQVGENYSDNVLAPIGHMLEVVPMLNPYTINKKAKIPFKILFRGKALENALVDIAPLAGSAFEKQSARSNEKGELIFDVEPRGSWIVNVIWAVPTSESTRAEFETYFSSLTFGYQ